jgi:uncharacterized membrane protein YdbT with pleckstrin-like domain
MWTEPYWVALGVAIAAVLVALALAVLIGIAIQRAADRRRALRVAADPERVTVEELQLKIDEERAKEAIRLAHEDFIQKERAASAAALAVASSNGSTEKFPVVSDDDEPAVRQVPYPRGPGRVRRYVYGSDSTERAEAS